MLREVTVLGVGLPSHQLSLKIQGVRGTRSRDRMVTGVIG